MLPNNIQVELVEGCNRMCRFCGIWSIWKNKEDRVVNYMDVDLAAMLAISLYKWGFDGKRIEFAMHGEPTLHPELPHIIGMFRSYLPHAQIQVTTNGMHPLKMDDGSGYLASLFEQGLNVLLLDTYVKKEALTEMAHATGVPTLSYYDKSAKNPYCYNGHDWQNILLLDDLGAMSGLRRTRVVLNHAGNGDPKKLREFGNVPITAPLRKKCSRPFREISIHWDGTVPMCCMDWCHENIMGKLDKKTSIQSIWESDAFCAARKLLLSKDRTMRPCHMCDYNGGFRLGLLKLEDCEMSIQEAHEIMAQSLKDNEKYAHKNSTKPHFYTQKNSGIRRFL